MSNRERPNSELSQTARASSDGLTCRQPRQDSRYYIEAPNCQEAYHKGFWPS